MSVFTNFLNLFKWNVQSDGDEEFNIDKALNENWDKIDVKYGELSAEVKSNKAGLDNKIKNNEETINNHIGNKENPHVVTKEQLGLGNALLKTDDVKDNTVTFTESNQRTNISSTEKLSTIFGKIQKYFSDLKTVAFTGSYNDLTDKPDISGIFGDIITKESFINLVQAIESNTNYTIPLNYKIGSNSLEVLYCGEKLIKGIHYNEIGQDGEISNTIQFTSAIGNIKMSGVEGFEEFSETLEIVVRGDYSN